MRNLNIKIIIIHILIFIIFYNPLSGQKYNTLGGVRFDTDLGFSLKQRIGDKTSLEGIYQGGVINENFSGMLLIQQHYPLIFKSFNFYLGAGYGQHWNNTFSEDGYDSFSTIPLVIGAEITFGRLNISTDLIPQYVISKNQNQRFVKSSAISLRYVLVKRKRKKKKVFSKPLFSNQKSKKSRKSKKNKKSKSILPWK